MLMRSEHDQPELMVECPVCTPIRPPYLILQRIITCALCGGANPRRIPLAMRVEFELLLQHSDPEFNDNDPFMPRHFRRHRTGTGGEFVRVTTELRNAYGIKAEGVP